MSKKVKAKLICRVGKMGLGKNRVAAYGCGTLRKKTGWRPKTPGKQSNPVAKHALKFNCPETHRDHTKYHPPDQRKRENRTSGSNCYVTS